MPESDWIRVQARGEHVVLWLSPPTKGALRPPAIRLRSLLDGSGATDRRSRWERREDRKFFPNIERALLDVVPAVHDDLVRSLRRDLLVAVDRVLADLVPGEPPVLDAVGTEHWLAVLGHLKSLYVPRAGVDMAEVLADPCRPDYLGAVFARMQHLLLEAAEPELSRRAHELCGDL